MVAVLRMKIFPVIAGFAPTSISESVKSVPQTRSSRAVVQENVSTVVTQPIAGRA